MSRIATAALVLGCLAAAAVGMYAVYLLVTRPPSATSPPGAASVTSATFATSYLRATVTAPGDVNCSVSYTATSPCAGDCWTAYQNYTGTVVQEPAGNGAPCPPLVISVSCNQTMPCMCMGADLPITAANQVTTCNDCTYLAPGESCYLACADAGMTMSGTPEITCMNGTWAYAGLPPTCNPVIATCPPVMNVSAGSCSNNGVIVQPGSTCVGAGPGDACFITCQAGYAIPPTAVASATCLNGVWTDFGSGAAVTLACAAQAACVSGTGTFTGDTCAGASCPATPSAGFGRVPPGSLLHK